MPCLILLVKKCNSGVRGLTLRQSFVYDMEASWKEHPRVFSLFHLINKWLSFTLRWIILTFISLNCVWHPVGFCHETFSCVRHSQLLTALILSEWRSQSRNSIHTPGCSNASLDFPVNPNTPPSLAVGQSTRSSNPFSVVWSLVFPFPWKHLPCGPQHVVQGLGMD